MVFWILLGLTIIGMVAMFMRGYDADGVGWGLFLAFIVAMGAGLIVGILGAIASFAWSHPEVQKIEHYHLHALDSGGTQIEGRFNGGIFLSYGYINGERQLNYVIERKDGGFELGKAPGDDNSVIYYKTGDPKVTITTYHYVNAWLFPWDIAADSSVYEFDVPKGAVSNTISVDNSK